jgi:hypothetical protein
MKMVQCIAGIDAECAPYRWLNPAEGGVQSLGRLFAGGIHRSLSNTDAAGQYLQAYASGADPGPGKIESRRNSISAGS